MKRLLVLAVGTCAALMAHALEVGQAAPSFDLMRSTTHVKLSDFKGKTIYLDFWASWCGPCKQSFPWMNDIQARYESMGLQIVALNVDQRADDATSFLKGNRAKFAIAFDPDGKTPLSYGIKVMPTSFLIGPDGKILLIHSGFRAEQRDELERQIKHALNLKE